MSRAVSSQRRPRRGPRTPDGTPQPCAKRCGKQVMWFDTNYGQRVCLDVVAVADPDSNLARYRIDWDAKPPVAVSVRKLGYMPDHPEDPRYSTHFDTCTMRDKVATK